MKRLLLIAVCCLLAVLSAAAAQVPDKTKRLVQKIEPSLQVIEKQLNEIEADFWKNVMELDSDSQSFLNSSPRYQAFNRKIADFVSCCGALQRVLADSDVDVQQQYPVEKRAIGILSVWKRLPQLHARIMGRRNPITREGKIALGADCINSILMTSEIHPSLPEYAALLDDMAIINMELFYITNCGPMSSTLSCHSPWEPKTQYPQYYQKYCKLMSEDLLITSAGEFFMTVSDLRKIIQGLRTRPYPELIENNYKELYKSRVLQETDNKYFYAIISHIEDDLDRIEREFWDTIYKGGDIAVSNKNLSRYDDFQRLLYCLHVDCRNFQTALRKKKIDSGEYNPVTDSIIIYNLGRSRDQELRRHMRRFFNRDNPLVPGSKKKRVELVYHFRAYDVNQETIPPKARSYIPYADLKVLNIPERLDEFCASNIALFKSDEREFKVLGDSAEQYFNAVKGLRRTIEHWKSKFAPLPEPTSPPVPQSAPASLPQKQQPVPLPPERVEKPAQEEERVEIPEVKSENLFLLAISKIKQRRFKEAYAYLLHLAEKNFAPAQYLISFISDNNIERWNQFRMMRRRGSGKSAEEQRTQIAKGKWLKKAAEAGYVPAVERWINLNNLQSPSEQEEALRFADRTQAIWRLTGKLADMSVDKRDQWLDNIRKQAAEGNAACQLLLSYCYAADNIIDHSPAKAKEWLQKAVDQEYPEALLWVWGWRPWGEWAATDEKWKDKAIAKGGIPPIADLVLGGSDLPESTLAKLEDAGKRGDEMAMCALLSYYSKRKNQYPKQFEQWKKELKQYRSFQELINYPFLRNWGWSQRLLLNAASKALGEKGSSDAPFGGQPFGGGPFGG